MTIWHAVETVPRDGREIIVWAIVRGDPGYTEDHPMWLPAMWWNGEFHATRARPRHWNGMLVLYWTEAPVPPLGRSS